VQVEPFVTVPCQECQGRARRRQPRPSTRRHLGARAADLLRGVLGAGVRRRL